MLFMALTAGCGDDLDSQQSLSAPSIKQRGNAGIEITFPEQVQLERIRVTNRGEPVGDFPTVGTRRRYFLPLNLERAAVDQIEFVEIDGGRIHRFPLTIEAKTLPLTATIEAPAGQDPVEFRAQSDAHSSKTISLLVGPDRKVVLALNVENRRQQPSEFEWVLEPPPGTEHSPGSADWNHQAETWTISGALQLGQQNWREAISLELPPTATADKLTVTFQQRSRADAAVGERVEQKVYIKFHSASLVELRQMVSAGDLAFPTDMRGDPQFERAAEEVKLPNLIWSTLLGWLQPAERVRDRYAEYAWQSLPLTNRTEFPCNLAIESFVTSTESEEPLLNFAPPAWKAPKEAALSEQLLRLAPGETARAVLPVYVRDETPRGEYRRHVRVRMVGYDEPLLTSSAPLVVTRGSPIASSVVIASLSSVVLAWCLAPWFWPRILRGLSVDQLTTIALLSGAHFLIAYASRFAADAIAALAGPFAVFLAGIGNEGLTSALVAALLVLVPRVGVLTLSSLTVFLLQAMFTGQLGLVDLLMVTVSIIVQELLLFLLGITREASTENLRDRLAPTYALRMALAIGLGNALALAAQFCLATELYRLYFATWYVVAVAVVTGLIYGGLGAASGTVLGCQLRRTAR